MNSSSFDFDAQQELVYLRTAVAIRERAQILMDHVKNGSSRWLSLSEEKLAETENLVAEVMLREYPTLDVPYHSRWRHLDVGGVQRIAELDQLVDGADPIEKGCSKFDLVILSVLLDAGAGSGWSYLEARSGQRFSRSEGLAVASYHLLRDGLLSKSGNQAFRADADMLTTVTEEGLAETFQSDPHNELAGLAGRARLMVALGEAVQKAPQYFCNRARPGGLFEYLHSHAVDGVIAAPDILIAVLDAFAPIWPGRASLAGENVGDAWKHEAVPESGLVPFHKLSQWLVYSLVEPLEEQGIRVSRIEELTGLAEYRNGGLLVDSGVIVPREAEYLQQEHEPGSELIVEWRALTICLLDVLAARLRLRFGKDAEQLPLARVLQGGTWQAGRELAANLRPGGSPPFTISSDGTVF